ncbi:MAG: Sensory box histidine kinase/response regulator [Myxococcales bacterium]|nr:Sensory box histidine kinase/response regulator [Myxococcales bacterium]
MRALNREASHGKRPARLIRLATWPLPWKTSLKMALHEILAAQFDEVLTRWKSIVHGSIAPASMASPELIDEMPVFLREIIAALRTTPGTTCGAPQASQATSATGHGAERLRLGFSLDAVVREYGALRDAIAALAQEAGITITARESDCITHWVINGIAHAVSEYTRQRDAELQRQHNEHVAFLAHELRNTLATGLMALDSLGGQGGTPSPRALSALTNALTRMHETIDHALSVARDSSGIELKREHTTVHSLVEETAATASIDADKGHVKITAKTDGDTDLVVDLRLIRSALSNLVRNAIKYTPPGGSVEVRGSVTADRATFEIEDRCGGLPEDRIANAFSPFVRMTNEKSGFGLGLAIAKQAADAHSGTIRVQNLPGCGCIFVLELPLHKAPQAL